MRGVKPFDQHAEEYDRWFDEHPAWFQSEVDALAKVIPGHGRGFSIGVGTGRFDEKFSITHGIDPSESMSVVARSRGITTYMAKAEDMPFDSSTFNFAVMITTLCFLEDIPVAFRETRRVLKPGGNFIIGMIDKESPLGQQYQINKKDNPLTASKRRMLPVWKWKQRLFMRLLNTQGMILSVLLT
jgi:ubiquinone/menaquinone biosynthesis C-methylase UbiE